MGRRSLRVFLSAVLFCGISASIARADVSSPLGQKILFVGDSHSVGPFGRKLDELLRTLPATRVETRTNCGTSPSWWLEGRQSFCGYFNRTAAGAVTAGDEEFPTPVWSRLLAEVNPTYTIVALGTNQLSADQQVARTHISQMMRAISDAHSQCVWIGPPAMRAYTAAQQQAFYDMVAPVAEENHCRVIDSRNYTAYPADAGDGYHYNGSLGPLGRELGGRWAQGVFDALTAGVVRWPVNALRGANITVELTSDDLRHFAQDWHGNVVRLLQNEVLTSEAAHNIDEPFFTRITNTIDAALAQGLYVVISASSSFDDNDRFFNSPERKQHFKEFWERLATRYRTNNGGIAYDIMNEPHDALADEQWSAYARELTAAIRRIDARHTVMVEATEWGWAPGFSHIQPVNDDNAVYSFHFYGPMDFTHQRQNGILRADEARWQSLRYPGQLQGEQWNRATMEAKIAQAIAFRDQHHVPIWCGEFGVVRWGIGAQQWFEDFVNVLEAQNIGWAYYSYREWQAMDLEMSPTVRLERTARGETSFVEFLRRIFGQR